MGAVREKDLATHPEGIATSKIACCVHYTCLNKKNNEIL
jgi:hypothetical protein